MTAGPDLNKGSGATALSPQAHQVPVTLSP